MLDLKFSSGLGLGLGRAGLGLGLGLVVCGLDYNTDIDIVFGVKFLFETSQYCDEWRKIHTNQSVSHSVIE